MDAAEDLMPEPDLDPLLVFRMSREGFGVRLADVKEIQRPRHVRPVPQSPAAIRGLADIRGRMVTAADLPALVGQGIGSGSAGHLLVLTEPRDHFALWVPSEVDLVNVDLGAMQPRPAAEGEAELFDGFVGSERGLINVLSTEKIFLHCEQEVLRRYRLAPGS